MSLFALAPAGGEEEGEEVVCEIMTEKKARGPLSLAQRARISAATKEAMARPEVRARMILHQAKALADPRVRSRLGALNRKRWKDPAFRAKVKAARDARPGSGRSWTPKDEERLRELYPKTPLAELAVIFRRTEIGVKARANLLGVKRARGHKPWTAEQIATLRKHHANTSGKDLAAMTGHPVPSVEQKLRKMGLVRDPDYKREVLAKCGLQVSSHPRSIAARLKKGNIPPNKGLRRPGYSVGRGRMQQTQFKKGQRSRNWLPVGTIRKDSAGYLRVKVGEGPGGFGGRKVWDFIHKRVWEAANGPVPKGHRLWWKDRNHENCALENLELLTDKEHMARTTIHNLPPGLKKVIVLKAAIKRKITRMEKERRDGGKQRQYAGKS
jgi:HNH endonuclease